MTTIDLVSTRRRSGCPTVRPTRRPSVELVSEAVVANYVHQLAGGRRSRSRDGAPAARESRAGRAARR